MKQPVRITWMDIQLGPVGWLVTTVIGAILFLGPLSSTTTARTIHRNVPTYLKLSATRAADGTITAKGVFTSPDQRCLSVRRFGLYWFQGNSHFPPHYTIVEGGLAYGGPAFGDPFGFDGFGAFGEGWLHPVSSFAHSPLTWRAVWPGPAEVSVTQQGTPDDPHNPDLPFRYSSTVASATGLILFSDGLGNGPDATSFPGHRTWKTTYHQGGNRVILKCKPSGSVDYRIPVSQLGSN